MELTRDQAIIKATGKARYYAIEIGEVCFADYVESGGELHRVYPQLFELREGWWYVVFEPFVRGADRDLRFWVNDCTGKVEWIGQTFIRRLLLLFSIPFRSLLNRSRRSPGNEDRREKE